MLSSTKDFSGLIVSSAPGSPEKRRSTYYRRRLDPTAFSPPRLISAAQSTRATSMRYKDKNERVQSDSRSDGVLGYSFVLYLLPLNKALFKHDFQFFY